MADSSLGIVDAAGATRQVDVFSQANGDVREAVVLGDPDSAMVAKVRSDDPSDTDAAVVVRVAGSTRAAPAAAATRTQVTASTTAVTVWPDRPTRRGGSLYNGSTGSAHLTFGTTSDTATADVVIPAGGLYELIGSSNMRVTQAVSLVWAGASTGTVRAVEWTA